MRKVQTVERSVRALRSEAALRRVWESHTGHSPKTSSIHSLMFFLDYLIGISDSIGEFWVSRYIAERFISRISKSKGGGIRLLPFLCEIGLIRNARKHSREAGIACRYRLLLNPMKKAVTIQPSETTSKRIEKARQRFSKSNDEATNWVRESMALASIPEQALDALLTKTKKDYSGAVKVIRSKQLWTKSKQRGRITTPFSNIPEDTREQVLIDGEQVTRLDINGSHLHMLVAEAERRAVHFDGERGIRLMKNAKELRELLSQGKDVYLELLSDLRKEDRKKTKSDFTVFLNGKKNKYNPAIPEALRKRFPEITQLITAQNRSKSGKTLGAFLQSFENKVIRRSIMVLKERGIHCVPVVDELLVPWGRRSEAIEIMSDAIFEICGTRALISGVRHVP